MEKRDIRLIERIRKIVTDENYNIKEIRGKDDVLNVELEKNDGDNNLLFGKLLIDITSTHNINSVVQEKNKLMITTTLPDGLFIINVFVL